MIVLAAKFSVKPERREDLIRLALSMLESSRAEPGCISYNFYEEQENKGSFLFFEEWNNQEELDEHFSTPHFMRFMQQFPDLIAGKPTVKTYEVKETKVLNI